MRRAFLHLACVLAAGCAPRTSRAPGSATPSASMLPASTEVATIDGKPVTYGEVLADREAGGKLKQEEAKALQDLYEVRRRGVEQAVTRRLLEDEARKAKKGLDDWFQQDFLGKLPEPSEAEIRQSFDAHKAQLPAGATYEQFKPRIATFLKQQGGQKVMQQMLEDLKGKHQVRLTLAAPEVPRTAVEAKGPSKGSPDAKVTIVEFSDFQCPFCQRTIPTVERLLKEYDGKVRLVFRHFPLDIHPQAAKAAEAGACAADQGKFWEMHDRMFKDPSKLAAEDLKKSAREIGLDPKEFDRCLDAGEKKDLVQGDQKAGAEAGVNATPAFFVNGVLINGAVPYDDFKQAVERELSGGKVKG